jgi:hypothetical protein
MSENDFKIAHLTTEQQNKLRQFENELGCALIAYEHAHETQHSGSRFSSQPSKVYTSRV